MNWGIIGWVLGALLTIYSIKFVFTAVRTLLSKETMETVLDSAGNSIHRANRNFKRYLKKKADNRKMSKQNETPIITIR